jgi:hypothetical protein
VDGAGGRLPSPAALAEIGRLFGFDEAHMTALARQRMPEGGRLALWIERESDPPSVNIVEPV